MITETTELVEVAAIVPDALERAGIVAALSGGAAASIDTDGRYLSEDLDFVTVAMVDELRKALEPIGFRHVRWHRRCWLQSSKRIESSGDSLISG